MTKRQIATLKRIIRREKEMIEDGVIRNMTPGLHAWEGGWLVTEGFCAVLFGDKPEGLPEGSREDALGEMLYDEIRFGRREQEHIFCGEVTKETIAGWKETAKQDKPFVDIGLEKINSVMLEGQYNAEYLLDVAEAVGREARLYIGRGGFRHWPRACSLWVMPKGWMDGGGADVMGYVMPRKPGKERAQ